MANIKTNRECVECGTAFDLRSPEKKRVGGLATTCPDCSEEATPRYLGLTAGDGKQASITVLKFNSAQDREAYREMWWVNSGMNTGKSCQISIRKPDPGVRFQTVTQSTATNHKGRAN
jgi:hypothetical protein